MSFLNPLPHAHLLARHTTAQPAEGGAMVGEHILPDAALVFRTGRAVATISGPTDELRRVLTDALAAVDALDGVHTVVTQPRIINQEV